MYHHFDNDVVCHISHDVSLMQPPEATMFFSDESDLSSNFGFVDTHDDAAMLIQACLRGSLQVVKRQPISPERPSVAQSGHVFIYEAKSSGIQR
ncbi:Global transcription regulator sge1 [Exophiala xenobiotica]|uniref:Uncharacterized protein n=1 Tax=Exophiala oligosperma TaxID=215243 RepID=A0A0D2A647_9EURO|nr:uncharacterized protein PV06_11834 [Exophiala oligosperma]KAK5188503.1 Global transcription regulator sge1 [Exophiala xenobiotica]KAK5312037.1 Global transcription regulator sge1 [Exophiala xenobiotica]KIW35836.1 hypothetical protein PV06_11834 [Exophiala oligosperma]